MKDPYELRVIADGLAEWQKSGGPAVDCMKYAETVLREIAAEFEAAMTAMVEPAKTADPTPADPTPADPTPVTAIADDTLKTAVEAPVATTEVPANAPPADPTPASSEAAASPNVAVGDSAEPQRPLDPPSAEEQAAALNIPPATPAS